MYNKHILHFSSLILDLLCIGICLSADAPMYISYVVGHGGGCQNNNPFEAEKSSSMDKKDNYNTEAVEELIVNWRKLMLQQETQVMLKF